MTDRNIIDPLAGTHIRSAAEEMVARIPSACSFNGAELVADVGTTVNDIVATYHASIDAMGKACRGSPERIAADEETQALRIESRRLALGLLNRLEAIDWSDLAAVVQWIDALAQPSDALTRPEADIVIAVFDAHGFRPGMFCGAAFNGDDREIYARWLVGQALDGLRQHGSIWFIARRFAAEWRQKFCGVARG
jgi:hypothetical protein